MAYLAATNITVTIDPRDADFLAMATKVTFPRISFGDSSLQYPAGGIPLPDIGAFGMKKAIKRMLFSKVSGADYDMKYDAANNTLRLFAAGAGTLAATLHSGALTVAAPSANLHSGTVAANAVSNLAVDVAAPTGNVANLTVDITGAAGAPAEVATGVAIAAQVIDLIVFGS